MMLAKKIPYGKKLNIFHAAYDRTIEAQGARIGALRAIRGWSNRELSELTGIAAPTLSQYIYASKQSISAEHIWRLAKAFNVPMEYIAAGETEGLSAQIYRALQRYAEDEE